MREIIVKVYPYAELSDKAKAKAREWMRELESESFGDYAAWEDDWRTIAGHLGIEFRTHEITTYNGKKRQELNIWWHLHTQGAGVGFDASYAYKPGGAAALKAHAPLDTVLHSIADALEAVQSLYHRNVTALIEAHGGNGLDITVSHDDAGVSIRHDDETKVRGAIMRLAEWMHQQLNAEYDYRTSDEAVVDTIEANEYEFTEDGKIH